jgi:phosphate transport system substrate-binding protein
MTALREHARRALVLALFTAGCTRLNPDPAGGGPSGAREKGALSVKGSDTMVILGQRWAEDYMSANPSTTVQVTGGGSGTGIAALINGSTDICESSRPMKDSEKAELAQKRKVPARETKVAIDALAIYVNDTNTVQAIAIPTLAKIYEGSITSWKELGGADHSIILYGREDNSGTYAYFKEHVLKGQDFAAATQALAGTSAVANAVKEDKFGIGYGGIAYLEGIRALDIKSSETAAPVAPTLATAQDGAYPLRRYLFFYTAGEPTIAMATFIDWVTGPGGQATIADVGYYPLPKKS